MDRSDSLELSPIMAAGVRKSRFVESAGSIESFRAESFRLPRRSRRCGDAEPIYENRAELRAALTMTSTESGGVRLGASASSMEGGRASSDAGNQTLSSLEGRGCLSPNARIRLAADATRQSTSDDDSGCALEEYSWVPSGLRPDLVHQYFNMIPEEKVPWVGSVGEKWRIHQLTLQLPPQDNDARRCRSLTAAEAKELRQFASQRKKSALGKGTPKLVPFALDGKPCHQCGVGVKEGELGIFSSRLKTAVWHPSCFVCDTCEELLIDLVYFLNRATPAGLRLFCGRHHAESLKPRCGGCDEIIFSEECTEAEGQSWHMHHFACLECDAELGGQRYVIRESRPYCVPCFQRVFADLCRGCRRPISPDQAHVALDGAHWHATEACYACAYCRRSLLGRPNIPRHGALFCGLDCFAASNASSTAASPAPAASRRLKACGPPPPLKEKPRLMPRLQLADHHGHSSEEENDYETVPSFRASPPVSPRDEEAALMLSRQMARMTASVHQEEAGDVRRYRQSSSRRQRRHRSLSDLRGDSPADSATSSQHPSLKSSDGTRHPTVTFCASARDPPPRRSCRRSRKSSRRSRAGSAGTSERSYYKAVSGRTEPRYWADEATSSTTPSSGLYDMAYAGRGDEHRDCSTCSSSSESDPEEDFLSSEFYLAAMAQSSLRRGQRRPFDSPGGRRQPPPTPTATKKKTQKLRGSKLAAASHAPSAQNCIVS